MSAIWAPSPRLVGAETGSPLTIWLPVDGAGDPLGRAAGLPLPVQMPVFGSQLDPVPVPVLPALVLPVPALVPEPAAWLPAEPAVAPLELPAELCVPALLELLLELEAG